MFTTFERLKKRSGKKGIDRPDYLKELVTEFETSTNCESREQVLANLANFSHDPINYEWLRELKVIDLFLDNLSEVTPVLRRFAIAGLCNLALDKVNKAYILQQQSIKSIASCLTSTDACTISSAITTLMFLVTPESKVEITEDCIKQQMIQLTESEDPRIVNLAQIFLTDYCGYAVSI